MKDKIKIMLTKIIYDRLGLYEYELMLEQDNVMPKKINNPNNYMIASKYFFLLNDINFNHLTEEEKRSLENLINLNNDKELKKYLEQIMGKLLISDSSDEYINYSNIIGPSNYQYLAPRDAITFALHYINNGISEEEMTRKESLIVNIANILQDKVGPSHNVKLAILLFDETPIISREL